MARGYSLLELVITLGIVAVVLGLSTPSFNMLTRHSVRREADRITAEIVRARNLASLEAEVYYVQFPPQTIRITTKRGRAVVERRTPLDIRSSVTETPAITFYPSGAASPLSLSLHLREYHCAIVITLRGRVRTTC